MAERRPRAASDRRDEPPKHDLWVVPYADMVTLLFALFVVLYSVSEVDRRKFEGLRYGIWMAFGGVGDQPNRPDEVTDRRPLQDVQLGDFELINSQRAAMVEFVEMGLLEDYEKVEGRSLTTVITDDTVAFEMPIDDVFVPGSDALQSGITDWLGRLLDRSTTLASEVGIVLQAPDETRVVDGREVWTATLVGRRRDALHRFVQSLAVIDVEQVRFELRFPRRTLEPITGRSLLRITFSNP